VDSAFAVKIGARALSRPRVDSKLWHAKNTMVKRQQIQLDVRFRGGMSKDHPGLCGAKGCCARRPTCSNSAGLVQQHRPGQET
jgi:hypothetical protein